MLFPVMFLLDRCYDPLSLQNITIGNESSIPSGIRREGMKNFTTAEIDDSIQSIDGTHTTLAVKYNLLWHESNCQITYSIIAKSPRTIWRQAYMAMTQSDPKNRRQVRPLSDL